MGQTFLIGLSLGNRLIFVIKQIALSENLEPGDSWALARQFCMYHGTEA